MSVSAEATFKRVDLMFWAIIAVELGKLQYQCLGNYLLVIYLLKKLLSNKISTKCSITENIANISEYPNVNLQPRMVAHLTSGGGGLRRL